MFKELKWNCLKDCTKCSMSLGTFRSLHKITQKYCQIDNITQIKCWNFSLAINFTAVGIGKE